MFNWFEILQDKYNSVYFDEDEQEQLLNRAQIYFINEVISPVISNSSKTAIDSPSEFNKNIEEILSPIMDSISVASDSSGVISRDSIREEVGGDLMYILSAASGNSPIRFIRHNDLDSFRGNSFVEPSASRMYYTYSDGGIIIHPNGPLLCNISLIREPRDIEYSTGTGSELPFFTHEAIVSTAIQLAGIASRDETLPQIKAI